MDPPYGIFNGSLNEFSAAELGALAVKEVLRRTNGKINTVDVDYIIIPSTVMTQEPKMRGGGARECIMKVSKVMTAE
jgi:acetyl-CoA acetyltransferase